MFTKTIHSDFSNHTLFVREVGYDEVPQFSGIQDYPRLYAVHNFDAKGVVFMYLGTGLKPREIVAWYRKGGFWSGFGTTFKSAIEGAQRDGWLSA